MKLLNPGTNNGYFVLVNGEKFLDSKYKGVDGLNDKNRYLCFNSENEIADFIIKSEKYFRDYLDGAIRYDGRKVYVTTDGRHLGDRFRAHGYFVYEESDTCINAEYVYIKHKIVVRKIEDKYKFCGAFGKILFEVARRNKLNLLVFVKE